MLKFESKDLLLAQVWHSDRAYPIQPCILEVNLWPQVSLAEL
jgi:hypothetical protein